jgi:hypothetical protein
MGTASELDTAVELKVAQRVTTTVSIGAAVGGIALTGVYLLLVRARRAGLGNADGPA